MTLPAPFIVGVDRSGTTLLRLMLDAHPDLAIPAETLFLENLLPPKRNGDVSKEEFLQSVFGAMTWDNLGIDKQAFEDNLDCLTIFSVREGIRTFYKTYAWLHGKTRWGDKTPYYRTLMPQIQDLLPEAQFVHLIRDGRDIALSLRDLWFGPGQDIEAQAHFWVRHITVAREAARHLQHYQEVHYETLVERPEETLLGICEKISLPFDRSMLGYHSTAATRLAEFKTPYGRPDRTPMDMTTFMAIHDRTKNPPDRDRIGVWRKEMSVEDLKRYEAIAGPLLRELGYETVT